MTNKILFADVNTIVSLIKKLGIVSIIDGVVKRLEDDFMQWNDFDKSARTANHHPNGVIELMPISNHQHYSFKYVNGHPKNINFNLPTIMAFGVLAEMETGKPLFMSEMNILTAIRTAGTSVMVAKLLARKDSKTMAVIGNGCQSEFQIIAFHYLLNITHFRLYDIDPEATQKLINNLKQFPTINYTICSSSKEAIFGSDIITTITADKKNSIIVDDTMISHGQHFNAVGGDCPGKTELSSEVLKRGTVYVEYTPQTRTEGEIQQMDKDFPVTEIWTVLKDKSLGRQNDDEITIFDSVGFALEDYSVLSYIYGLCQENQIGEYIDLVPELDHPKNLFGLLV
ncbi:ornithine cyclodeaminase [Klosneuvirus KNV1]|uniref:Ornithine cyclodeaminase n=1 Tax=Klosneuvirus KNV1 TaxID=1977640 RepID=A0A1V0SL93_9VIRU|nr:ornithine cyclodeaminase [Klosneuvirus KNV1]